MSAAQRPKQSVARNKWTWILAAVAIVISIVVTIQDLKGADDDSAGDGATTSAFDSTVGTDPDSELPFVDAADLPAEAQDTLALIDAGGPFPYDRDGIVFENREGLLPAEDTGYYHEYTVDTPGSDDRGARRIIVGSYDEFYYTQDHYESFVRIQQ
jgi:ribonuclease T1